jgi:hypothetical protein
VQRVPTESQRRNDSLGRGLGTPSRRRSPGYATTGNFQDRTWPDRERSTTRSPSTWPLRHPTQGAAPAGPVAAAGPVWAKGVSTLEPHRTAIVR